MRVVFDLTEDAGVEGGLPSPSFLRTEHDDVVIAFREAEIRLTYLQLVELVDGLSAFLFHGREREISPTDDPDAPAPMEEHLQMRKVIRAILDGQVGSEPTPPALRYAIERLLREHSIQPSYWRDREELIAELRAEVEGLKTKLAARAARTKTPKGATP